MGRVYYVLFSQINLFSYKLRKFNDNMLVEGSRFGILKLEHLIFKENHEVRQFFKAFFHLFERNSEDNTLDMWRFMEENDELSFEEAERVYTFKFNERALDGMDKYFRQRRLTRSNLFGGIGTSRKGSRNSKFGNLKGLNLIFKSFIR